MCTVDKKNLRRLLFILFYENSDKKLALSSSHFGPFPDSKKLKDALGFIMHPDIGPFKTILKSPKMDDYFFCDYNIEEVNLETLISEIVHPAVIFFKHNSLKPDINIAKMLFEQNQNLKNMVNSSEFLYYPELNTPVFKSIRVLLAKYPKSLKCYEDAISKYGNKEYKRNILDDIRLSFEYLLKDILSTSKSLENQIDILGPYLKVKGVNKELRSTYMKFLDYLLKYNNEYVKHNDDVSIEDLDFVMEMSVLLMKYLIRRDDSKA